ncbi:MAG: RagB/SusD family nutrient uptake outer membrane protein [Candidatus Cyclobacteriaceae bacterium M2_1C_046]
MKTNYILKFILVLLISFGCTEEFIEPEPKAAVLESNYYQTDEQLFKALISAYDPLQWTFVEGQWTSAVMLGEIRSDNANAGGDPTDADQPGWQAIDDFLSSSLTEQSLSFWKRGWWGVYRANLVIANSNSELENAQLYAAEAKFLRAFYHFDLFRAFGPIPVIDHVITEEEYTSVERQTISTLFEFITNDLEEAIDVLPEEKYAGAFAGRVSKTTAQALLGKAYLYWADMTGDNTQLFDEAAAALEPVISSGQYMLLDDYNELFAFGAKNTEESVFEIQYTNQVPHGWGDVQFIDGNMITQLTGIRGLCSNHPDYNAGWGFMLPTQSLYDHFLNDDTYRRDAAIISLAELQDAGCAVNQAEQNPVDYTGYWQQKYANYKGYSNPNGGDINLQKDPNEPIIRYADVLLMYAEALIRGTGSSAEALTYIDMVRERASGPGDNAGSFKTAQEVMNQQGWSALDLIWYERRAEFAGEGDRWFDLVRSGRAEAQLFGSRGDNFSTDRMFLAAPQKDIDNSAGSITEYPATNLFQ